MVVAGIATRWGMQGRLHAQVGGEGAICRGPWCSLATEVAWLLIASSSLLTLPSSILPTLVCRPLQANIDLKGKAKPLLLACDGSQLLPWRVINRRSGDRERGGGRAREGKARQSPPQQGDGGQLPSVGVNAVCGGAGTQMVPWFRLAMPGPNPCCAGDGSCLS